MKKTTQRVIFSLAAISLFALIALPVGAQPTAQVVSCVLVEKITVNLGSTALSLPAGVLIKDEPTGKLFDSVNITDDELQTNKWGLICTLNVINTVIKYISLIVLILSTGIFIYAGFLWMAGGDSPELKQRSGRVILAGMIGVAIYVLAKLLPGLISGILL